VSNEELLKLAAEAYVYGYPMVYTIEGKSKMLGAGIRAPVLPVLST
jgi:hypothetical protein